MELTYVEAVCCWRRRHSLLLKVKAQFAAEGEDTVCCWRRRHSLLLKAKAQFAAGGEDTVCCCRRRNSLLLEAKTQLTGRSDFTKLEVHDVFFFTCTKKLLAWD